MNYAIRSVIEAIQVLGHDEDFSPTATEYWIPTDAIAGTVEKIEVLRSRIEQGLPLFHPWITLCAIVHRGNSTAVQP